VELAIIDSI